MPETPPPAAVIRARADGHLCDCYGLDVLRPCSARPEDVNTRK
ncbi:hypothetical protein ACFYNW_24255 [Streptomyces virginiae]